MHDETVRTQSNIHKNITDTQLNTSDELYKWTLKKVAEIGQTKYYLKPDAYHLNAN